MVLGSTPTRYILFIVTQARNSQTPPLGAFKAALSALAGTSPILKGKNGGGIPSDLNGGSRILIATALDEEIASLRDATRSSPSFRSERSLGMTQFIIFCLTRPGVFYGSRTSCRPLIIRREWSRYLYCSQAYSPQPGQMKNKSTSLRK